MSSPMRSVDDFVFPDGSGEKVISQVSYQVTGLLEGAPDYMDADESMSCLRAKLSGTLKDFTDLKNQDQLERQNVAAVSFEPRDKTPEQHKDSKTSLAAITTRRKNRLILRESIRDKEKCAYRPIFTTKLMSPRNLKRIARDISLLECRPFATMVFDKLPRELRDQVYDYLWQDKDVEFLDREISCNRTFYHYNDQGECLLRAPFYAVTDFVGAEFAREAAMWYFRKLTQAESVYHSVNAFLQIKEFGNQIFSPIDILRTFTITIDWNINAGKQKNEVDQEALRTNLLSLLTLKPRDDFTIVIYLDRNLQFSREMFHTLETIRPIYHEIVKHGLKIKVLGFRFFTPAWRHDDYVPKRPITTTSEHLNYYLEMNPEDWLVMKGKELMAIKQAERRRKCQHILENMWVNFMDICETLPWKNWPGNEEAESWESRGPQGSVYLASPEPSL